MSRSNMRIPRFMTIREAAEHLLICDKTVRKLISQGLLSAHRVGRKLLISEDDLRGYIATRRT